MTCTLITRHGERHATPIALLAVSPLFADMDLQAGDEVPLPNVDAPTWAHVEAHLNGGAVRADGGALVALMHAANYLDLARLIEACAERMAAALGELDPDDMLATYAPGLQYTDDEWERIAEEGEWTDV